MRIATLLLAAAVTPLFAQEIHLPANLEKLAATADESVNVTLDGSLLQLAGRFLDDNDPNQVKVKKLIAGLKGIYVRRLEFSSEGEYNPADLEPVRAQFQGPGWARIVGVKSRDHENADVYLKTAGEGQLGGVGVVVWEPREFTIVSISGTLDVVQLVQLGGEFDIPKLELAEGVTHTKESQ